MPVACSAAGAHYLAVGVISAPEYVHRRAVLRATWMGLDGGVDVCANFVVRARHVPMHMDSLLHAEATAHGNDILRVDVPWNETRMRGPILTLAAWVRHASLHFPMARYVAKVDDDSYLHAPGLANMLRSSVEHAAPLAHTYMGTLTWYSWFANKWDRCGFGWTWQGSMGMGHNCRNNTWASQRCVDGCGPASGPFPFAAGYLIILSAPLATAIASSPALDEEMRRLSSASVLHTHKGYRHTQIFEDVWLGSFVHRFISRPSRLAPAPPIAFVQLFRSESVVDLDQTQWASTLVLEVGANTRNTLDHELLPHEPDTFLVSFEPLLDKYATLLARHSRPDTRSPLGHHHARALVLPFAVSAEANSIKEFKISGSTDGCASLLDPVSSYYSTSCTNLSGIAERRAVPSVSLEHVLSTWLAKRDIALAKIDAQGLDVGVVRSAGAHLNRLRAVQLEVVRDRPPLKCTPQYAAEPGRPSEAKCNALVAAMAEMGFAPYATNCYVHKFKEAGGCEAEMMFVRPGFDMGLVRRFCMSQRPHSCGPGAWSVPADRRSWDPATKLHLSDSIIYCMFGNQ